MLRERFLMIDLAVERASVRVAQLSDEISEQRSRSPTATRLPARTWLCPAPVTSSMVTVMESLRLTFFSSTTSAVMSFVRLATGRRS